MDLASKNSFGIHFETFQLTDEGFHEPRNELQAALRKHSMAAQDFVAPLVGETIVIDAAPSV
jgi:hypothetical protein